VVRLLDDAAYREESGIDKVIIVDCRFPYEYHGGHIPSAINVTTPQQLENEFFQNPPSSAVGDRTAIIFHCEFSQHRGMSNAVTHSLTIMFIFYIL
jgi:rhodanese-related sulfurtransferase